jgi:peptide/nickel transport system substrate-binding protein
MRKSLHFLLSLFVVITACQCGGPENKDNAADNVLNVRIEGAANILNPLLPSSGYARYVAEQVFVTLGTRDLESLELKPYLSKVIPKEVPVTEGPYKGGLAYTFEIQDQAKWDNGSPITAADVEFTLKIIFCPTVKADIWRSYYEDMQGFEIDPANPRKFTIYMRKYYLLGIVSLCTTPIYPAYHYDATGLLGKVALADLLDPKKSAALNADPNIVAFGAQFMDPKYSTDKGMIVGGTAYSVEMFDPAQGATLVRKANWWGDAYKDNPVFRALPSKIVYKLAKADDVTINMLQAGDLDIATSLPPSKYIDLQNDAALKEKYDFKTYWSAQYNRIMVNTRHPLLSDRKVRQAIAQSVDYEYMLNTVQRGMATRIVGPVNPQKTYYAKDITPYQFNTTAATELLKQAGWSDTNGDGTVDKIIGGNRTELVLQLMAVTGSEVNDLIVANMQVSLAKSGIKAELKATDLPTLTKLTQAGDFQLAASGSALDPGDMDLYQIYHSNSLVPKGDNRYGISNARLDQILEDIRKTPDAAQRDPMYIEMQKILHEEVPELYLYAPVTRYVVSKKYDWTPTALRPGFWEMGLSSRSSIPFQRYKTSRYSIIPNRKHHQSAALHRFYAMCTGKVREFWILGARIENQAFGTHFNDIIIKVTLAIGAKVERDGIEIIYSRRALRDDGEVANLARPSADWDDFMATLMQLDNSPICVSFRIGRSAQH